MKDTKLKNDTHQNTHQIRMINCDQLKRKRRWTKMRNERARFNKRMKRERHGAASEVRHIERADYQPPQPHVSVRPPPARQKQTKALLSFADTILLADAKRRHGKRHGKRVQNLIMAGRYR
jgi:hypothetical protein